MQWEAAVQWFGWWLTTYSWICGGHFVTCNFQCVLMVCAYTVCLHTTRAETEATGKIASHEQMVQRKGRMLASQQVSVERP